MCGVFGFVSRDGNPISLSTLKAIAKVTEQRGRDAWGMAWIDGKGRMKMYKQAGKVSDSLALLNMAADARVMIGHCRYATQGDPENNLNNHPHACDDGWIVHNGVIPNYRRMLERFDLWPVSDCDSEVLALLIEQEEGSYLDRCVKAVESATGPEAPLVLLGLWKPDKLVVVRQGNPLHLGTMKTGYYLASLPDGLPGKVRTFRNNEAVEFGEEVSHVQI